MRRLRLGLIGGGPGSFIGPVHRIAAEMDRRIELVAGAFSSNAARSAEAGATYRIDPGRAYPSYEAMIAQETGREDSIDLVAIVTPNHLHLPAARAALGAGIAVLSDKPATATLAEAQELAQLVAVADRPYALSYTYTGYPLVREARARIAAGDIGTVRKVVAEYSQGWLAEPIERDGNRQAEWRVDPAKAGIGGCIGDIGVHAFNLIEFVCGSPVSTLFADLGHVVKGRALDDDVSILLRLQNGGRGVLIASQISTGERNGLRLRVYGDKGALDWRQEEPNTLLLHHADGRSEILRTGDAQLGPSARMATRLPGGHPEGYLEAFANIYGDFASWLQTGARPDSIQGIEAGLRSMEFVETAVTASREQRGWVTL